MGSIATEENWLTTADGQKLYTKTWKPDGTPKARLVFVHGFSDHCNCYTTLFSTLAREGIKVHAFDQRGWGRSVHEPSQRGLTGPTSQVLLDITTFIKDLPDRDRAAPLFLMGHSMGGGEVLMYAATGPRETVGTIRGFLLEAPLLGLPPDAAPGKLTAVLGRLASKVLPHRQLVQKLDPRKMSRDPEVCAEWRDDPLCHDTGTLEGLAGLLERTAQLSEGRVALKEGVGEGGKTRLWVGQGSADEVVSHEASRKWYEGVDIHDKEMRVYEGWYHKLHAEAGDDKLTFANDVAKWILDRCEPIPEVGSVVSKARL